jgi:predicted O-methyltransferase YrrM
MTDFVIDTSQNMIRDASPVCRDPYDHLGASEWVDKQIEYGEKLENISGKGLVEHIQKLSGELIGCEIGVCHGFTTELLLKQIPNIKKIYAVDSYPSFVDWDGTRITEERQSETKQRCFTKLSVFGEKVVFIHDTSTNFSKQVLDEELDFIFVDGDHSYEATLADITNYWPKVKKGGIFAGHDINLNTVDAAVKEFFKDKAVTVVENNAWFIIK